MTEEQRILAEASAPRIVAIAGPGSGKTHTLIERYRNFQHLAAGTVIVTFTVAGAIEMRDRIEREGLPLPNYIGTLHGWAFREERRRRPGLTILSEKDADALLREVIEELRMKVSPGDVRKAIEHPAPGQQKERIAIMAYRAKLAHRCQEDYSTLLLSFLTHIGAVPRVKHLMVDEYQDSADQDAEIYAALNPEISFLVGDPDQCQPAGTMVMTDAGSKAIETLDAMDTVKAWDRNAGRITGGHAIRVARRTYSGTMFRVEIPEVKCSTMCTPNHKWLVRWTDRTSKVLVTYIMWRKDRGFRVGWCQLFQHHEKNGSHGLHFFVRCRIEKAEKAWIVGVHETRTEASIHESIIALRHQIPTTPFEPVNGAQHLTAEAIQQIFAWADEKHGRSFLEQRDLEWSLPFYTPNSKRSRTTFLELHACNLLSELHSVPAKDEKWHPILIQKHVCWSGEVYSLDVAKHHSYVADGLVTLNSIYGFRGASPRHLLQQAETPGTFTGFLTGSFRCDRAICLAANAVIARNRMRMEKSMVSMTGRPGEVLRLTAPTQTAEFEGIAQIVRQERGSVAVLSRYNASREAVATSLALVELMPDTDLITRSHQWFVTVQEVNRQQTLPTGELLSRMAHRLGLGAQMKQLLWRAVGSRDVVVGEIAGELAIALREIAAEEVRGDDLEVLTVHGAKGREFDTVIVQGVDAGAYGGGRTDEEDRRLLFVAISRARHRVVLTTAGRRVDSYTGRAKECTPSPFFADIPHDSE